MRIISKFQDYYDAGLAYGVDPDLVYVREQDTIDRKADTSNENCRDRKLNSRWSPFRYKFRADDPDREYEHRNVFLSFCGKRYYGIEIESRLRHETMRRLNTWDPNTQRVYCWTAAEADEWSEASKLMDHVDDADAWGPKEDHWANLEYGTPIVLEYPDWRWIRVVKNPCLKDLGFSRVVDPYTAFQEISMYLAGPLSGWEDPDLNPEPTGAEKMANKGMDPVYGFRKKPGGK